jgi:hypothetical protein
LFRPQNFILRLRLELRGRKLRLKMRSQKITARLTGDEQKSSWNQFIK